MMRGRLLAGVAAAGMLAGCGPAAEETGTGGDALAEVRAAAATTGASSSHVALSVPNVEVDGDTDPAAKVLALAITAGAGDDRIGQKIRVIGDDAYYTLGKTAMPGIDPAKYIRFPTADFATTSVLSLADPFDPAGVKGFGPAITDAQRAGEGAYTGKLDLTAAPGGTSGGLLPPPAEVIAAAGEKAKAVPYQATVDGAGRLTSLTLQMPAYQQVPSYPYTMRWTDFGKPVRVTAPAAGEIADVPDDIRELLTS